MPLTIDFYSDILCIWGWVGQHHNRQLLKRWDHTQVEWRFRYLELYGDVKARVEKNFRGEEAWDKYASAAERLVSKFEGLSVHPDIWRKTRPTTSMMAHQTIKAVEQTHGELAAIEYSNRVREAFFAEARDVSQASVLTELLKEQSIAHHDLTTHLQDGSALAKTIAEFRQAENDKIPGSPSWVMDNNRYRLFGNVKPEIIIATVDSLITR